jgi:hypothetical protein
MPPSAPLNEELIHHKGLEVPHLGVPIVIGIGG